MGSYSLKAVLPALVPEMTYDGMAVANGQDAGLAWESLVRGTADPADRERTRKALLDYCGQDTLPKPRSDCLLLWSMNGLDCVTITDDREQDFLLQVVAVTLVTFASMISSFTVPN